MIKLKVIMHYSEWQALCVACILALLQWTEVIRR